MVVGGRLYTIRAFLEARPGLLSVVRERKGSGRRDVCGPGQKRQEKMGLGQRQALGLGVGRHSAGRGDIGGVGEANCRRTEMPDTESAVLNDQLTVKVEGARRPKMT